MSSKRWSDLTLGEELGDGLVACLRGDGTEAVLRRPPSPVRGKAEIAALLAWDGRCTPLLLDADDQGTELLLERIRPGEHAESTAGTVVAEILAALHVPAPYGVPPLAAVVEKRLTTVEPLITPQRLAWAWAALERLAAEAPPPVLLHGALGPGTLVRCARRGLCAVSAAPAAGDPAYDAACWIHGGGRPGRRARFDALSATAQDDGARLRDWCGIVAVHG